MYDLSTDGQQVIASDHLKRCEELQLDKCLLQKVSLEIATRRYSNYMRDYENTLEQDSWVIQWRPRITIAVNVINRVLL
jgi:thiaminase